MSDRLRLLGYRLSGSFWLVPGLMTFAAAALALFTLRLDRAAGPAGVTVLRIVYGLGADGARSLLSTVAGSIIAVAGTVFSLTIVVLTLAASQFGPRLIRAFVADRTTQLSMGTFTATFVHCLLVLPAVRGPDEGRFVPGLSVNVALLLTLLSVAVLIFFIHHVALSIQATRLVQRRGQHLEAAVSRLYPDRAGRPTRPGGSAGGATDVPPGFEREAHPVPALASGYVQAVDDPGLLRLAGQADLLLRLERRAGDWVVAGEPLALAWPRLDARLERQVRRAFVLGPQRTLVEDVEFAVLQLVEIATRALSPAINDPFTASACVDRLGAALARLAATDLSSAYRYDARALRVIAHPVSFRRLVDLACDQIRQYGSGSPAVSLRLLESLVVVARRARRPEDREAVRRQADMIARGAAALPEEEDRRAVTQCYQVVLEALDAHHAQG